MKRIISLVVCSALSMAAAAQSASDVDKVNVAGQKHGATHRYHMDEGEFTEFKGAYSLSNGKTLVVTGRSHDMTAWVSGQPHYRIVATGPDSFSAQGHLMTIRLDVSDSGKVSGELVYVDESAPGMAALGDGELMRVALR